MDGFDARHIAGWSIFGLTIIALAGAVAANRVLVVGIEAATKRQSQTVQAISAVRQRTQQWPLNEKDPLLNDADRSRIRAVNVSFRLDQVDTTAHSAYYIVRIGDHSVRVDVPERM